VKRLFIQLLTAVFVASFLLGCGGTDEPSLDEDRHENETETNIDRDEDRIDPKNDIDDESDTDDEFDDEDDFEQEELDIED